MSLASLIGDIVKSGKVTVSAKNVEAIEITAADKKIDVKALDKKFIKEVLEAVRGENEAKGLGARLRGVVGQINVARGSLGMLKELAEELKEAGVTITLTYQNDVVITLGCEANAKFSRFATGTKAIEINSPKKLVELGI